jgi:hypothetical protein
MHLQALRSCAAYGEPRSVNQHGHRRARIRRLEAREQVEIE